MQDSMWIHYTLLPGSAKNRGPKCLVAVYTWYDFEADGPKPGGRLCTLPITPFLTAVRDDPLIQPASLLRRLYSVTVLSAISAT